MDGSLEVLEALNNVYHCLTSLESQAHLQEHALEADGWGSSKYWDYVETKVHTKCTHKILDRMFALGGNPTFESGYEVKYFRDDFSSAIATTIESLSICQDSIQLAIAAAEQDGDCVTECILYKCMKFVEKQICVFEGLAKRFGALGPMAMTGDVG